MIRCPHRRHRGAGIVTIVALPDQNRWCERDGDVRRAVGASIGLYQFNVVIPQVGPGDQVIELIVDGVSNNQNLYMVIGQ